MALDSSERRKWLKAGDFAALFNDIGWDRFDVRRTVDVGGISYPLQGIAEKRGVQILECNPATDGKIPDYAVRRRIEKAVIKIAAEHLLIFVDDLRETQIWQWVAREKGKPAQVREATFHNYQSGETILQRLERVTFSIDEENDLTLLQVVRRLGSALDKDKLTSKFYDKFEQVIHPDFLTLVGGIANYSDKRWYTSVMINRIMFLFFVQSKKFLNRDLDYLQNRLRESTTRYGGENRYYSSFLRPLFFEGLAKREVERQEPYKTDLGTLPYLSGSLFTKHELELNEQYAETIDIPDAAFESLFEFFGKFSWQLDERLLSTGDEINPDVLGYIFEKYINQPQMGAYYTKEDITEYISRSTIIPFILTKVENRCVTAFSGDNSVWRLLADHPDDYIFASFRHGVGIPLPVEIRAGLHDSSMRAAWNRPAPPSYGLPGETWRDVVSRHQRHHEVRELLLAGSVKSFEDLVTCNVDIRQFVQDAIDGCEGANLLEAFWEILNGSPAKGLLPLSILDPTCGSGAFLFAAMEILKPLYEACLSRMEGFIGDAERLGNRTAHRFFREIQNEVGTHIDHNYYILKKIIVNNLYGVDIMEEATEICKLRLFLKLAAQIEPDHSKDNLGVEPLPDIDFNIRSGNSLVGYATEPQMQHAVTFGGSLTSTGSLPLDGQDDRWRRFKADLDVYSARFNIFLSMQEQGTSASTFQTAMKRELESLLRPLRVSANDLLADQYGKTGTEARQKWQIDAKPFHWFVEFYRIAQAGGFDCIIGNPPYVEYSTRDSKTGMSVRDVYQVMGYETRACDDLYAFTMERAYQIINPEGSLIGLIVPISLFGTDAFMPLQRLTLRKLECFWTSCFANRPSQLFSGAQKRLTIIVGRSGRQPSVEHIHTTGYLRWHRRERDYLFPARLSYVRANGSFSVFPGSLEKLGSHIEMSAFTKITRRRERLAQAIVKNSENNVYYTRKFGYFLAFMDFIPTNTDTLTGEIRMPTELKRLPFRSPEATMTAIAVLSSTTFFWFWNVLSDCRNLNRRDLLAFPVNPDEMPASLRSELSDLGGEYLAKLRSTSHLMSKNGMSLETFDYGATKSIIDQIDNVLAVYFNFNADELDFILNYDIKYRDDRLVDHDGIPTALSHSDADSASAVALLLRRDGGLGKSALRLMIEADETDFVEFKIGAYLDPFLNKPGRDMKEKVLEEVVGFLNCPHSGTLLIGVSTTLEIVGIDEEIRRVNPQKPNLDGYGLWLNGLLSDRLSTKAASLFYEVTFPTLEGKTLCRIDVNPASKPVYLLHGQEQIFYRRVGTRTEKLAGEKAHEYIQLRWPDL